MNTVISIHEAKTQLSKLIKQAEAGQTIYIGAFGKPQVILAPLPQKTPVPIGIWQDKRDPSFDLGSADLIGSDPDIIELFTTSTESSL